MEYLNLSSGLPLPGWKTLPSYLLNLLQLQFPYLLTVDSKNTCPMAHMIIVNIRQDKLYFVTQKHCTNVILNYSYTSAKQLLLAFPDTPKQMRYHPTCTACHAFPIISPNTPCFSTTSIPLCVCSTKLQILRELSPCLFVHTVCQVPHSYRALNKQILTEEKFLLAGFRFQNSW